MIDSSGLLHHCGQRRMRVSVERPIHSTNKKYGACVMLCRFFQPQTIAADEADFKIDQLRFMIEDRSKGNKIFAGLQEDTLAVRG